MCEYLTQPAHRAVNVVSSCLLPDQLETAVTYCRLALRRIPDPDAVRCCRRTLTVALGIRWARLHPHMSLALCPDYFNLIGD